MLSFLGKFFSGAVVGVANAIPGVSGGTMAVILNVYDKMIGSISNLKKKPKESLMFLIPFIVGAGLAIVALSHLITYLLEYHYMIVNFFFIGVILGSIPMIYRRATEGGFRVHYLIAFMITFAIMVVIMLLEGDEKQAIETSLNAGLAVRLFVFSAIAAISMLIPGISGSFMLLLFGVYNTVMASVKSFNIIMMLPIGFGILFGLFAGAKLIDIVMQKFPQMTYFAILGFVIGSVPVLFHKIVTGGFFKTGSTLVISVAVLIVGVLIVLMFDSEKFKNLFQKENQV